MAKYFDELKLQINSQIPEQSVLFIDSAAPEISWQTNFKQCAYQITAVDESGNCIWNSGIVNSPCSRYIRWEGTALKPDDIITLNVTAFGENDNKTTSSCRIALGKQHAAQWDEAKWIYFDRNNYSTTAPSPCFRKEFSVRQNLKKAVLSISAKGIFEPSLDGKKLGDDCLAPGWTDFNKQIPFVSYEISRELAPGDHCLGITIADGWCCGNLTIFRKRNVYNDHPEFILHLALEYNDGSKDIIVSDSSWNAKTGPILAADLYDGESYDSRLEMPGWDTVGFDCSKWIPAAETAVVNDNPPLIQKTAPPVRMISEIKPVQIISPHKDIYIWDFGQNFTGVFRLKPKGIPGRLYTFRVAEMLEKDNSLYTLNYRSAKSTDYYICGDDSLENPSWYIPRFTFHGFRYLQIDGFQFDGASPEELEVTGIVMHSDLFTTGDFNCGNELANKLFQNVLWGQKDNFLEIPTDCPQRDERLGWTGDSQLFAPMAVFNMDCVSFYRKYLRDVRDAVRSDGASPSIAPAIIRMADGAAGWGDAIVLMPYTIYTHYGYKTILTENYDAMVNHVKFQLTNSDNFIRPAKNNYGDWLALDPTPPELVSTAYFAYCTNIVAKIAAILGKNEDEKYFSELSGNIKSAFCNKFADNSGLLNVKTQGALIFALAFELVDNIGENVNLLEKLIIENGTRLSTGFLATGIILKTLAKYGKEKLACDLILQQKYPSWIFSILQGATTCWERWNSYTIEDGFGNVAMNSFNHYSYGAAMEFFYRNIAGIDYSFEKIIFKTNADKRFSPVNAHYDSPFGMIKSAWCADESGLTKWEVEVPFGIPAQAVMPDGSIRELQPGKTTLL